MPSFVFARASRSAKAVEDAGTGFSCARASERASRSSAEHSARAFEAFSTPPHAYMTRVACMICTRNPPRPVANGETNRSVLCHGMHTRRLGPQLDTAVHFARRRRDRRRRGEADHDAIAGGGQKVEPLPLVIRHAAVDGPAPGCKTRLVDTQAEAPLRTGGEMQRRSLARGRAAASADRWPRLAE